MAINHHPVVELQSSSPAATQHAESIASRENLPPTIARINPTPISSALIVGGGSMGAAIAYALKNIGIRVCVVEADHAGCASARRKISRLYESAVQRGLFTRQDSDSLEQNINVQTEVTEADLVIEAVYENMELKKKVFSDLNQKMSKSTIFASNTSYLDINEIASAIDNPQRFLGLHFFNPAHIMKLVEIIQADATGSDSLAAAFALVRRLRKIPVLSGVCDGFIGNRILSRYRETADFLLLDGAFPFEIDNAMTDFGYAMGPYEAQDLSGLDIAYANRRRQDAGRDSARRYVTIADQLVEAGRLGRKVNAGWYRYTDGKNKGNDPFVEQLILDESEHQNIRRRNFSSTEIRDRLIISMINEACAILEERIARCTSDIDIITIYGYGFPKNRGGLMHLADQIGAQRIFNKLTQLQSEEPVVWKPADGLLNVLRADSGFTEYFNNP